MAFFFRGELCISVFVVGSLDKLKFGMVHLKRSVLCVLCMIPFFVQAQESDKLLEQFEERFGILDSLIFPSTVSRSLSGMDTLEWKDVMWRSADSALVDRIVEARIRTFRGKTGLQLTGQTYFRPDAHIGRDEEDAISRYRGKIQAELRWYFFQSSLFKRKGKIKELVIEGDKEKLALEKERLGRLQVLQEEMFQQRYDSLLVGILLHRIENLALLSRAQRYLLDKENVSSDELLTVLNEKAEAERMLYAIPKAYEACTSLPRSGCLLISVDTAAYLSEVKKCQSDLALLDLEIELKEQKRKNTSYWSDFRLAPFVRYSYYTRPEYPNSTNIDAGVSFTIPINNEHSRKRRELAAERDLLLSQKGTAAEDVSGHVKLVLLDMERYNRLLEGEVNRLNELKEYLVIRGNAYRNRIGEYSRLSRIKEYNMYLSCWEKLLRYRYQRDMCLGRLQTFLSDTPIQDFCSIVFVEY